MKTSHPQAAAIVGAVCCSQVLFLVLLATGCGSRSPTMGAVSDVPAKEKGSTTIASADVVKPEPATRAQVEHKTASGEQLYAQHCAACHGANGDGRGPAAVFVFPRPRDFRAGRFRLISTANNVPTREDLDAVLVRGMPGSAMVSWAHLPESDRRALAEHVLKLRREGVRELELKLAAEAEEELSEEQLAEAISRATNPGEVFEPPAIGAPSPESIVRGKELFTAKGCAACHGDTGKGDGQQKMIDSEGLATRPRDLTLGIYKGNHDPKSVYRRIWLGLPGSPMPASQQLTPDQVTDLVHYTLSLSTEPARKATVMRRAELAVGKVAALPKSPSDWQAGTAATLQTTPLWWRDQFTRTFDVQAVHDGQSVALRISWDDPTHDAAAVRPDQFEDMVAVEMVKGPQEPFLGMGAAESPAIDLWQWRAGTHDSGAEDQLSDEYPFDTAAYRELAKGKPLPDFVTARVVGNPLATREHEASNLAAKGFGSLTFRPKASQVVAADAEWKDGRWTVVLQRPLAVNEQDGLPLKPSEQYSIAFAIWDGSAHDRGPQKLITLWNDLRVE